MMVIVVVMSVAVVVVAVVVISLVVMVVAVVIMVKVVSVVLITVRVVPAVSTVEVVLEVVLIAVILVIVVVLMSVVLVRALAYAGAVIDTFVEVFTVDMGVGVLIIVSNVLVGVNVNEIAGVMTDFEFAMPDPLAEFRRGAALDCRSMVALNCDHVLQARMPAYHV